MYDFVPHGYLSLQNAMRKAVNRSIMYNVPTIRRTDNDSENIPGKDFSKAALLELEQQKVEKSFRRELSSGLLPVVYFTREGMLEVSNNFWKTDESIGVLRSGNLSLIEASELSVAKPYTKTLLVPESRFQRYFDREVSGLSRVAQPMSSAADCPPISRITPNKNKGGRPTKYDWEGAYIEMARLLFIENDDIDHRKVTSAVQEWFIQQTGECPADSLTRGKVKRFYDVLWPPET